MKVVRFKKKRKNKGDRYHPRPYEEKACAHCGKMFGPKRGKGGKYWFSLWDRQNYCSHNCWGATKRREYQEKPCKNCGKMFGPKEYKPGLFKWSDWDRMKCCSVACATVLRYKSGKEKVCQYCGESFSSRRKNGRLVPPGKWDTMQFCSPTCAHSFKKMPYRKKPCEHCGKLFGPRQYKRGKRGSQTLWFQWNAARYCSRSCAAAKKRGLRYGENGLGPAERHSCFRRDGWRCIKCGWKADQSEDRWLEVDHIVPRALGGSDDLHNLQTLCSLCNAGKSVYALKARLGTLKTTSPINSGN